MPGQNRFNTKMANWVRRVLSCCESHDDESDAPRLVISEPSNFRREDVSLPGLTQHQYTSLREKAITDAGHLWETMHHPLRSNPTSTNDLVAYNKPQQQGHHSPAMPPYRDVSPNGRPQSKTSYSPSALSPTPRPKRLDRIKRHSKKFSDSFTHSISSPMSSPLSDRFTQADCGGGRHKACSKGDCEMQAIALGKLSHESSSSSGITRSDEEHDSAVAGVGLK